MEEFEISWKPETGISYSRKFVEFCSAKALPNMCQKFEEDISTGSFSRFSFDMMLAWEMPSSEDEQSREVRTIPLLSVLFRKSSISLLFTGSFDLG